MAMDDRDEVLLDLDEAIRFRKQNPSELVNSKLGIVADLSDYIAATPEALTYLAQETCCSAVVIGLRRLDAGNAIVLANWEATLCFSYLDSLDAEVAAILSESSNTLVFESLREIRSDVASALAMSNTQLDLSLDNISLDVANVLMEHTHELWLRLKTLPSEPLLNVLANHTGYRLQVTWKRPTENDSCRFVCTNPNKKVFVVPRYHEATGQWFENVYIGDVDFYPDTLVSPDGIITVL
jgi:hypothetical protein